MRGHEIAFLREGTGEPVLLLHGITTYSVLWRDVIPLLAPRFDVVAPDLLGCGRSAKPLDTPYSLANHALIMAELVASLGAGPVHVVGHDLGGGIAQLLAVRSPELVRSLTLVNTVGYDLWPVQPITALRIPILSQIVLAALEAGAFGLVVRRGLHHAERATPELLDALLAPLRTREGRRGLVHFARSLDNADLMAIAPELPKLTVPVTILWGMSDPYLPFEIASRLHRAIPGSRLLRVDTAGHYLPFDEPGTVAAVLLETARLA